MSKRLQQVGEEIQHILGAAIQSELKDPRVGFATVTRVEVSADLSHATAFISVMGEPEQQQETMQGLERARGFLRRIVAQELRHMRTIPELRFRLDTSLDYSLHIDDVLRRMKQEEAERQQSE